MARRGRSYTAAPIWRRPVVVRASVAARAQTGTATVGLTGSRAVPTTVVPAPLVLVCTAEPAAMFRAMNTTFITAAPVAATTDTGGVTGTCAVGMATTGLVTKHSTAIGTCVV